MPLNYYEELGVNQNATVEEIRLAYKALARVVHPDAHPDPESKAAAEMRMQRLNALVDTLTRPDARAVYDASLGAVPVPVTITNGGASSLGGTFLQRQLLWIATATVAAGGFIWAYIAGEAHFASAREYATHAPTSTAQPLPLEERPMQVYRRSNGAKGSLESALVGSWLYIASPHSVGGDPGAPRPESVQLYLAEQDGNLFGRYSARYIPDAHAVPETTFVLNGRAPASGPAVLAWSDPDGSSGTVQLSFRSPNSLDLTWWTTDTKHLGATSGSVLLTRLK